MNGIKIKKTINASCLLLSICFANASAQNLLNNSNTLTNNSINSSISKNYTKNYTKEQIYLLDNLLEKQDYVAFYDTFKSINVEQISQINYLDSKKYIGHTPLYWLMAEYYAQNKDSYQTHKWLYIATIMTQQDAYLCTDISSRIASQKLLRTFPATRNITHRTPHEIDKVMPEVIFFIENLKTRTNPSWACVFGNYPITNENSILTHRSNWASTRAKVLKSLSLGYKK